MTRNNRRTARQEARPLAPRGGTSNKNRRLRPRPPRHPSCTCSSPKEISMVLAACPRCLMYVLHLKNDPKCPNCKYNVLLNLEFTKPTNNNVGGRNNKKR